MVMLGEPRLVEAQPLGELDLFKQLVEGLALRHPRPCLIVTECPKPHACSSRKLDLTLARLPRKPNRSDAQRAPRKRRFRALLSWRLGAIKRINSTENSKSCLCAFASFALPVPYEFSLSHSTFAALSASKLEKTLDPLLP